MLIVGKAFCCLQSIYSTISSQKNSASPNHVRQGSPVPGVGHNGPEQISVSSLCSSDLSHGGRTEWSPGLSKYANHIPWPLRLVQRWACNLRWKKTKERSVFCVTVDKKKKKIYFPLHVNKKARGSASCWQPPCYLEEVNKASQQRRTKAGGPQQRESESWWQHDLCGQTTLEAFPGLFNYRGPKVLFLT